MTTYYFPSDDGAAEYDPGATSAGIATFTGNLAQSPAGSYSTITANPGTNPQTYTVVLDYTGPGTGTTYTTVQTPYTDANHSETLYNSPQGSVLFILTNGPIPSNYSYTFSGVNVPFAPTGGSTTDPTVCFASGTLIRTTRGDVAVEHLVCADRAVTVSGSHRMIRWLGHRTVDCRQHPRPHEVHPVRIAAHAFGENSPERDLFLSPGHPVLVGADEDGGGGYLVPIMCLLNGTTIERVAVDSVTYWHIELDEHDILLAEGLPAESYLDWGDRSFFAESSDHRLANPDFVVPGLAGRCRPVAIDGPAVEAQRRRLDTAFSTRLAVACAWPEAEAIGY